MTVKIIEHATDEPGWTEEQQAELLPRTLVPLDRGRRDLRVPMGCDGQDDLIREQIASSVSFIQDDLGIPIIKESVYVLLQHDRPDAPITFNAPGDSFVLFADRVQYQTQDVDLYTVGDWPEVIELGDSDQIAPGVGDGNQIAGNIIVKPPGGQWPAAANNHYALFYTRGIKNTNKDLEAIRQMVILKMRDAFFGSPLMKGTERHNSAYGRIARGVRNKRPTHRFHRIS